MSMTQFFHLVDSIRHQSPTEPYRLTSLQIISPILVNPASLASWRSSTATSTTCCSSHALGIKDGSVAQTMQLSTIDSINTIAPATGRFERRDVQRALSDEGHYLSMLDIEASLATLEAKHIVKQFAPTMWCFLCTDRQTR